MASLRDLAARLIAREADRPVPPAEADIRQVVLGVAKRGAMAEQASMTRRAALTTIKALRKPARFAEFVSGMAGLEQAVTELIASHASPDEISEGRSGTFDSCDLRHWIVLAEMAGVPVIPAREILALDGDEMAALTGPVQIPDQVMDRIRKGLRMAFPAPSGHAEEPASAREVERIRQRAVEKTLDAGDLIPPGHVVRTAICGPNTMKALAGTGTLRDQDTAAAFDGVTVGCGWVREGNRTRIDVTDERFVALQARGHEDTFRFLIRPWFEAGRRNEGIDPHFGTGPNAAQSWPAEWRVYVRNGEVVAVGNYYAWAGSVDSDAARGALKAKRAAEKILDVMRERGVEPVTTDLFISHWHKGSGEVSEILEYQNREFPLEDLHFTLDFIEGVDGEAVLLEGGPPHLPTGLAHPTAFSGCRLREDSIGWCDLRGVAFGLREGVEIGDPRSWAITPATHAMSFDDVELLAQRHEVPLGDPDPEP